MRKFFLYYSNEPVTAQPDVQVPVSIAERAAASMRIKLTFTPEERHDS